MFASARLDLCRKLIKLLYYSEFREQSVGLLLGYIASRLGVIIHAELATVLSIDTPLLLLLLLRLLTGALRAVRCALYPLRAVAH